MTFATLSVLINAATAFLIIAAIVKDKIRHDSILDYMSIKEDEWAESLDGLKDKIAELELKLEGVEEEAERRIDIIKEEIDERVDNAVDNKISDLESRVDDFESEDDDVIELKGKAEVLETKIEKIRAAFSGLVSDLED